MIKSVATRSKPADTSAVDLSVRVIRKQEFAKRLFQLMEKKRMTQAELARATKIGRDSISNYIRARTVPTPPALEKLASFFNVKPEELYPNYAQQAMANEQPAYDFKQITGEPEFTWVQINMKMKSKVAAKIMAIIHSED